jgi:hypothetical protein
MISGPIYSSRSGWLIDVSHFGISDLLEKKASDRDLSDRSIVFAHCSEWCDQQDEAKLTPRTTSLLRIYIPRWVSIGITDVWEGLVNFTWTKIEKPDAIVGEILGIICRVLFPVERWARYEPLSHNNRSGQEEEKQVSNHENW